MAHLAGRHLHQDGTYTILIDPSAPRDAHGRVVLDSGRVVAWHSPNGRDVHVDIGDDHRGVIVEDGFADARFTLPRWGRIG